MIENIDDVVEEIESSILSDILLIHKDISWTKKERKLLKESFSNLDKLMMSVEKSQDKKKMNSLFMIHKKLHNVVLIDSINEMEKELDELKKNSHKLFRGKIKDFIFFTGAIFVQIALSFPTLINIKKNGFGLIEIFGITLHIVCLGLCIHLWFINAYRGRNKKSEDE